MEKRHERDGAPRNHRWRASLALDTVGTGSRGAVPTHIDHSMYYTLPISHVQSLEEEENESLSNPDVVTKYKAAGKIVNQAIATVQAAAKPGTLITDLCDIGDKFMTEAVAKEFKGKEVEKGIAVPTCISVNHCVGHFSPVQSTQTIKDGDMVKIDLGCHIDGFASQAAHTFVVGASKVTGREADVMQCAKDCYEACARMIKPGNCVDDVPPMLEKIAKHYGCSHVAGVMTNQMQRFIIDQEIGRAHV